MTWNNLKLLWDLYCEVYDVLIDADKTVIINKTTNNNNNNNCTINNLKDIKKPKQQKIRPVINLSYHLI